MQQDHEGLINASLVSTSEVKATRTKLITSTSADPEVFIKILKRVANLNFVLFSSSFPLYNQVYEIIKSLRDYVPNSISDIQHDTKTIILWVLLFKQGVYHKEICWDITDALDSLRTWLIRSLQKNVRQSLTSRYLQNSYKAVLKRLASLVVSVGVKNVVTN